MCEGSASIAVDRDGVEGACGGREVLPVGLLTRPRSDPLGAEGVLPRG